MRYLKTIRKREPRTRDSFYPGQFVFTLKLDEKRGYCYTAQDGGYVKTDGYTGADLGGGCRGCAHPPEMTCGFLIQLVFCKKKLCGLLEETSAPPPKKILDPPLIQQATFAKQWTHSGSVQGQ